MPPEYAWLIVIFPFLSFLIIAAITRPFHKLSGWVTILGVLAAMVVSFMVLKTVVDGQGEIFHSSFTWFTVGDLELRMGLTLDPLAAIMLIVVTSVSFLVQVYSVGSMQAATGYP